MLKILNLIIYSNDIEDYINMYHCLDNFYKIYENHSDVYVKSFFLKNIDMDEECKLEDNILYVKGEESLLPGIINKTLSAFEYFQKELDNYDYIVRTNISTIIDFKLLAQELEKNPINFYGGGNKQNLQWIGGGIKDSTWFGTNYIEGTGIILTPEAVKFIINNINYVKRELVDDLAIAIFMREHASDKEVQNMRKNGYVYVPCFFKYTPDHASVENRITDMIKQNKIIFYRNKCCNIRKIDSIQMSIIAGVLKQI